MPTEVVLSTWIGVGGCGCPNSASIKRMTFAFCELRKRAPNSASAADATTSFKIAQVMRMFPFSWMGLLSCGKLPRKKLPPALLWPWEAVRYNASE